MKAAPLVLVVGIDGSEPSLRVLRHALRLCAEAPCELHLCNVQPALTYAGLVASDRSVVVEHLSGSPGLDLMEEASELVRGSGRDARFQVLHGHPAEELARYAGEVHADLLLLGTRGLNPAKELLLGSVAHRASDLAACPVVTMR